MKKIGLFILLCVSSAVFAAEGVAQTPAGTGKIGLVNTTAFAEEKAGSGITKYKAALKALNDELQPATNEINSLLNRYRPLVAEIDRLRQTPNTPVATLQAKITEGQDLETTIKRKQEDFKTRYDKRYQQVVGPAYLDIMKALTEYAKLKGFAVILDGVKLEQADILIGFDDRYDVTKDFIVFYNARPTTAVNTTVPK
ncbi:MAG: OmpH family outer membrane protein [Blastocatellia bacterium]